MVNMKQQLAEVHHERLRVRIQVAVTATQTNRFVGVRTPDGRIIDIEPDPACQPDANESRDAFYKRMAALAEEV